MPITEKRREILLSLDRGSLIEIIQLRAKNAYRHLASAQDLARRVVAARDENSVFNRKPRPYQEIIDDEYRLKRGYVYVMYFGIGNIYKIGVSNNPSQRLDSFSGVLTPFEMNMEHVIRTDDAKLVESALHEYFIHKHLRGEWFTLNHEDLELIKCMKEIIIYTEGYYGNEALPIAI